MRRRKRGSNGIPLREGAIVKAVASVLGEADGGAILLSAKGKGDSA